MFSTADARCSGKLSAWSLQRALFDFIAAFYPPQRATVQRSRGDLVAIAGIEPATYSIHQILILNFIITGLLQIIVPLYHLSYMASLF